MRDEIEAKITEWQGQVDDLQKQVVQMTKQLEEVHKLVERITGAIIGAQELLKIAELKDGHGEQSSQGDTMVDGVAVDGGTDSQPVTS